MAISSSIPCAVIAIFENLMSIARYSVTCLRKKKISTVLLLYSTTSSAFADMYNVCLIFSDWFALWLGSWLWVVIAVGWVYLSETDTLKSFVKDFNQSSEYLNSRRGLLVYNCIRNKYVPKFEPKLCKALLFQAIIWIQPPKQHTNDKCINL